MMTRSDARERREKIAAAAAKSDSIAEVAQEFGVSAGLVRRACREFGVTPISTSGGTARLSRERVVADLRSGKSAAEVAGQYRVPERKILGLQKRIAAGDTRGKQR